MAPRDFKRLANTLTADASHLLHACEAEIGSFASEMANGKLALAKVKALRHEYAKAFAEVHAALAGLSNALEVLESEAGEETSPAEPPAPDNGAEPARISTVADFEPRKVL